MHKYLHKVKTLEERWCNFTIHYEQVFPSVNSPYLSGSLDFWRIIQGGIKIFL